MPRAKIETAFLGAYTVAALDAAPEPIAGALIKRLVAWILRDELPADLAPELRAPWAIIEEESRNIHASRKQQIEAGRKGGEANGKRKESEREANAKRTETKSKSKIEIENMTPASAGVSRAHASVDGLDPSCPLTDEEVSHFAPAGMTPDEIRDWRDYYESREWKIEPNAPRPMTRAAARASLRRWHTMQGVREAREAHLDAKADERAAKRDARLSGPAPVNYLDIERLKEEAIRNSPTVNLDELP